MSDFTEAQIQTAIRQMEEEIREWAGKSEKERQLIRAIIRLELNKAYTDLIQSMKK